MHMANEVVSSHLPGTTGEPYPCWSFRGCHGLRGLVEDMESECPHARRDCYNPCPSECFYTACTNKWHRTTSDFNLLLDDSVDRSAAIKRNCYTCEYFLVHGPRLGQDESIDWPLVPGSASSDSSHDVTIHLF